MIDPNDQEVMESASTLDNLIAQLNAASIGPNNENIEQEDPKRDQFVQAFESNLEINDEMLEGVYELHKPHAESGHGPDHVLMVWMNARAALANDPRSHHYALQVELACILHDVDDYKLFKTKNYANARRFLIKYYRNNTYDWYQTIIRMIDLVSTSKNKNDIPQGVEYWMLIPRDCDRLEALGFIGMKRCYETSTTRNRPFFTSETPRVTNELELKTIMSDEKFSVYDGNSASTIDHFYDKLVYLKCQTGNPYLLALFKERMAILHTFLFTFGRTQDESILLTYINAV